MWIFVIRKISIKKLSFNIFLNENRLRGLRFHPTIITPPISFIFTPPSPLKQSVCSLFPFGSQMGYSHDNKCSLTAREQSRHAPAVDRECVDRKVRELTLMSDLGAVSTRIWEIEGDYEQFFMNRNKIRKNCFRGAATL